MTQKKKDILFATGLIVSLVVAVLGFHWADEYSDALYALPILSIFAFIGLIRWKG